jgi:hypothetical protein
VFFTAFCAWRPGRPAQTGEKIPRIEPLEPGLPSSSTPLRDMDKILPQIVVGLED